jgi:hypothetical protein
MRLSLGRFSLAGWLAVAAMLALSSPGVNAVKAQEAHVTPVAVAPTGPSCQQGEVRAEARDHSELMALGRRIAASSPSSRERVVVLGTEGRNDAREAPAAPAPEPAPAR